MKSSKRILEISIPDIGRNSLFLSFLAAFIFSLCCTGLYYQRKVRPFFKTDCARLLSSSVPILAIEEGKVGNVSLQEGDIFGLGQTLGSIQNGLLSAQLKQMDADILRCSERIEEEKKLFEHSMQRYLQVQKEMDLGFAVAGSTEQSLDDMQDSQRAKEDLELELKTLELDRSSLKEKSQKLSIAAPFDGILLKRLKQPGDKAETGDPLFLVCSTKDRWVEALVPEKFLSMVACGSPASISFLSYPKKIWDGSVTWVSPVVENGYFKVKLSAEDLPIQVGLNARVSIRIH